MLRKPLSALLVALLAASCTLAAESYYRTADGQWKALTTAAEGTLLRFSISPEMVGGGATLVILDKPDWMVLADETPPMLANALLDGNQVTAEELEMGLVAAAPAEVVFAVRDDGNPLDGEAVVALLNGARLPAEQVKLTRLDTEGKYLRIAVSPGTLPQGKYRLTVEVADLAPAHNVLPLVVTFSTAPILVNGSFEETTDDRKAVGWSFGAWSSSPDTKYLMEVRPGGVEGEKALLIEGQAGNLNLVCSQTVDPLKPGQTYVFSGQYKTEGTAGCSVLSYLRGEEVDYLTEGLPTATEWTAFSWEFQLKEHDSVLVVVRTGYQGEVWFDDLKVAPAAE